MAITQGITAHVHRPVVDDADGQGDAKRGAQQEAQSGGRERDPAVIDQRAFGKRPAALATMAPVVFQISAPT